MSSLNDILKTAQMGQRDDVALIVMPQASWDALIGRPDVEYITNGQERDYFGITVEIDDTLTQVEMVRRSQLVGYRRRQALLQARATCPASS